MTVTTTWLPSMNPSGMHAGQTSMQKGYELSTQLLRDTMQLYAPSQLQKWDDLTKHPEVQILTVDGNYDHMHYLLEAMKLPHARIAGGQYLCQAFEELPQVKAILIGCASNFPDEAIQPISEFVMQGGLLITSDWAIKNVLEIAFPGKVKHSGVETLGNEFVNIELNKENDPETKFLGRIFEAAEEKPRWWLENASYPIKRKSKNIDVILYSWELKAKYGSGSVMVRFDYGRGQVFHMISHAYLQQQPPLRENGKGPSTQSFVTHLGVSEITASMFSKAEEEVPNFDGEVAAATSISAAVFLTPLLTIRTD